MATSGSGKKGVRKVLFLGTDEGRYQQFASECGPLIGRLYRCANIADASILLKQKAVELLVLDLEGFSRSADMRSLGELISSRAGLQTLALCPSIAAGWLLDLMHFGLKHYCLSPYLCAELTRRLEDFSRKDDAFDMTQRLDDLGEIVGINPGWLDAMGYTLDEVIGTPFVDYLVDDCREAVQQTLVTTSSNPRTETVLCQLKRKNGSVMDVALNGVASYNTHGEHLQTRCELRGVDFFLADKSKSESQLQVEKELKVLMIVRSKIQQALMGIKDVNELSFLMCHELRKCPGIVGAAFFHKDANDVMQLDASMSRDEEEHSSFTEGCESLLAAARDQAEGFLPSVFNGEFVLTDALAKVGSHKENSFFHAMGVRTIVGTPILAESIMFDEDANTLGALCLMLDRRRNFTQEWLEVMAELGALASFGLGIIEWNHEKANLVRQLRDFAMTDTLTGAANRRSGQELMDTELECSRKEGTTLTLIMLDVDKFKTINDTNGHEQGDQVLKAVTRVAKDNLRPGDVLVRWGGEEFLIVAPKTDARSGFELAEKVRNAIAEATIVGCDGVKASLGVSQLGPQESLENALHRADIALYRAKETGRNRCIVADAE